MKKIILVGMMAAVFGLSAQAQPAGVSDSTAYRQGEREAIRLQTVEVSVQKRSQSSLEVPVAVNALSGSDLIRLDVRQFDELSEYIPGMQMQLQSPNNPGYVIRGVTSDDGDSRSQARVSIFQDGISISRSRASAVELFDLERIEVVKGPQGTLFGRGAEIGALHILRKKPVNALGGEVTLGYGSYNRKLAEGFINTPIRKDVLLNRFAFTFEDRDGFIKNLSGGDLNGKNTLALRNSTRLFAGSATMIDLVLDYQRDDYPGTSFKNKQYAPAGGDGSPHTTADLELGNKLYIKRNLGGAGLLIHHDLNHAWKFNSISGFRAFNSDESFDADGTASPLLWVSEIEEGKQFSQEFRLNYGSARFSGFAGASYFYENTSQEVPMHNNEQALYPAYISGTLNSLFASLFSPDVADALFPALPPLIDGKPNYVTQIPNIKALLEQLYSQQMGIPLTLEQVFASLPAEQRQQLTDMINLLSNYPLREYHEETYKNTATNHAAELFADGSWQITPRFGLTAGVRLSYERQQGSYEAANSQQPALLGILQGSTNMLAAVSNGKVSDVKNYYSAVARAALSYRFGSNNLYAGISRGRRPGVVYVEPASTTFLAPEIILSYETGLKGVLLGGRLNYDLAAYYYDWSHFQSASLRVEEGASIAKYVPDDAGKAHSLGFEAALRYAALPCLSLLGSYAWIDGKFNDSDEEGNPQEYAGHRFRLTPKHTFSIGADFSRRLRGRQSLFFRPAYSYKSKVYFEDNNDERLTQSGYGLLNCTAGFRFEASPNRKSSIEIGVYGKNISNTKYIIDAGNSGNAIGFPTFVAGSPAVFGGQIRVGF